MRKFKRKKALLLFIDVQGRLAQAVVNKKKLFSNLTKMIKAARILGLPIVWTEQAPEKIGRTVPGLARLLTGYRPIRKISFSCFGESKFQNALQSLRRKQVIVMGIETHVCVYQTVRDLVENGFEVQVVADAVSARSAEQHHWGLERIREVGGTLTSSEMIICELLEKAQGRAFQEILQLIK